MAHQLAVVLFGAKTATDAAELLRTAAHDGVGQLEGNARPPAGSAAAAASLHSARIPHARALPPRSLRAAPRIPWLQLTLGLQWRGWWRW